jgi:hypothetical protein
VLQAAVPRTQTLSEACGHPYSIDTCCVLEARHITSSRSPNQAPFDWITTMRSIPIKIKRFLFRSPRYHCCFCHQSGYKSPGGLTRHERTCSKNPANLPNPPAFTPPSRSPSHALPSQSPSLTRTSTLLCTPASGLFLQNQNFEFPPHTPAAPLNNTVTPIYDSPRRIRWTQKGRLDIHIHSYLDGELLMYPTEMILMHL